jgi:uncharacterized protein
MTEEAPASATIEPSVAPADAPAVAAYQAPATRPVENTERISSVDMLRGVALLGILLMNIQNFGLPGAAYDNPTVWGGATGWNLAYWAINQVFFEGKMRFLFSLLFGAGAVLLTERAVERGAGLATADIWLRRCLWMTLFGLLHAYLIWEGDILYTYGTVGLGLFVFRVLRPKTLLWSAAFVWLLISLSTGLGFVMGGFSARDDAYAALKVDEKQRTKKQKTAIENYQKMLDNEDVVKRREKIDEEIKARRGSYGEVLAFRAPLAFQWQTTFMLKFGVGDVLFPMMLGMALYKMGILSATRSLGFYGGWALFFYTLGIPVLSYVTKLVIDSGWDLWVRPYLYATYEYGRFTMGLGHLFLLLALYRSGFFAPLMWVLSKVGQMAFSNYILTSILMTLYFNGYGLGNFAKLERHQLLFVAATMWSINLILSPLWLRYFRFGPLEWAWRTLTYWKRQPFRRAAEDSLNPSAGLPSAA